MPKGTVKKIVSDRGFGFIAADDGKEYFFHQSGVDTSLNFDSLRGGEAVSFDIEQSQKGPRANHVRAAYAKLDIRQGRPVGRPSFFPHPTLPRKRQRDLGDVAQAPPGLVLLVPVHR